MNDKVRPGWCADNDTRPWPGHRRRLRHRRSKVGSENSSWAQRLARQFRTPHPITPLRRRTADDVLGVAAAKPTDFGFDLSAAPTWLTTALCRRVCGHSMLPTTERGCNPSCRPYPSREPLICWCHFQTWSVWPALRRFRSTRGHLPTCGLPREEDRVVLELYLVVGAGRAGHLDGLVHSAAG